MPTFIQVFIPVFLKIGILGLKKPGEDLSTLGKVSIGLDYALYVMYFLEFLVSPNALIGAGWLYPAAITAGVGLFVVDAIADILCQLVKRPGMYGISLKLRYVCCGLGFVIIAIYAAMRFMGIVNHDSTISAIRCDATAALCVVALGIIIVLLKWRQKNYSQA